MLKGRADPGYFSKYGSPTLDYGSSLAAEVPSTPVLFEDAKLLLNKLSMRGKHRRESWQVQVGCASQALSRGPCKVKRAAGMVYYHYAPNKSGVKRLGFGV